MAATISPKDFEREGFLSAPDERDAGGFIQCWNPECDGTRWVNRESMVSKCWKCGDEPYEYDVDAIEATGNKKIVTIQGATKKVIQSAMRELGVSRADLARRLSVSRAAVTQMFRDEAWTIDRLQRVAEALGSQVHIRLELPPETVATDEDGVGIVDI